MDVVFSLLVLLHLGVQQHCSVFVLWLSCLKWRRWL